MSAPASLPRAIASFVTRSKELATADPVISYFCKLYAVEQILSKQLHTSDTDVAGFAMGLLDDIETFKKETDADVMEIVQDKEASVAYVLNFSNKIFGTALMQIQEQRTSKQTAMSLMAVVNFFELLQLWKEDAERIEELEEIGKKTKYAKYHAARILKALKGGEDPNDYVPPQNEFKKDEDEEAETNYAETDEAIPVVEPEGSNSDNFGLPTVPTTISQSTSPQGIPKFIDEGPSDELNLPEPPQFVPDEDLHLPETPKAEPKPVKEAPKPVIPKKEVNIEEILESSEVYSKAQKHARFAISAMNYEDKSTAVKELSAALELLGKLKE